MTLREGLEEWADAVDLGGEQAELGQGGAEVAASSHRLESGRG